MANRPEWIFDNRTEIMSHAEKCLKSIELAENDSRFSGWREDTRAKEAHRGWDPFINYLEGCFKNGCM